jgi:hypothetical protein
MTSEHIQSIRSKALRCRELAGAASDAEVAEELLRIAAELEAALHVLGDQPSEEGSSAVAQATCEP